MAEHPVTLSGGSYDGEVISLGEPWPRYGTFLVRIGVGPLESYGMSGDPEVSGDAEWVDISEDPSDEIDTGPVEGPQGPPGPPGPIGPQGLPGEDGRTVTHRGDWDAGTTYSIGDVVLHEGVSYYSNLDLNTGHEPGGGDPHWGPLSAPGPQGEPGAPGAPGAEGPEGPQGEQGDPGSPLPTRQSRQIVTASLATNATETGTVTLAEGYRVLRVASGQAMRLRLYTRTARRDADLARPVTDDPTGDHGCVVEVVLLTLPGVDTSPVPQGYSMADPPTDQIPYSITNLGAAGPVTVDLVYQVQEA